MAKINAPHIRKFSATTTTSEILSERKQRKAVKIVNNGAATVELLHAKTQVYGDGIPIAAGGEYTQDHFNCQGQYFVIASAGIVDLRIEETIQHD